MTRDLSVIVSTRNRPDDIVACVRHILASQASNFELIVVDQSDAATGARAEAAVGVDPRLRWIHTNTRGLSVSRNIGVAAAQTPLIAFTDDDCRVPPDWIETLGATFAAEGDASMLFAAVILSSEDRKKGYAAEFEPKETRVYKGQLPDMRSPWGVGAHMLIRRSVLDSVGIFDPTLGAGAPFHAGEEIDFTIRALSKGFKIVYTPKVAVIHLGVREGVAASYLLRGYGIGLGATLGKHIRCGTPGAARLLAQWLGSNGWRVLRNILRFDRHPGAGLLAAVVWGVYKSFGVPIDRARCLYRDSPPAVDPAAPIA